MSPHPFDLSHRTVLVTGASSGIGRETAMVLSQLGARLILVARAADRLELTRQALAGDGHVTECYDLGNFEGIPAWMRQLADRQGPLDGLVHCAGLHAAAPLRTMAAEQADRLWRINVAASLWLAKGFRQRGVNRGGGSLVFLASVVALVGEPAVCAYAATKGAVVALTKSLATELARESIRVNCIAPGYIRTRMTAEFGKNLTDEHLAAIERAHPLGLGEPADVAHGIAYLLSPAARWVTGTTLIVDGGYTAH